MKFIFSITLMIVNYQLSHGQMNDSINRKRFTLITVGSGVAYTGSMIGLDQVWYSQYDRSAFHFFNDAGEWMQMDKAGHFYSAFQLTSGGSRILQWSGLPNRKSDQAGALTSFAFMASIEVLDGFSSAYGASATDLLANTVGIGFYLGQKVVWNGIRITPKFSFRKSGYAPTRPNTLGASLPEEIIKDYNGQTQWLSIDMDKFITFPKWLNIAIGYGVDGMIYANTTDNIKAGYIPYRQYYLSLDFDPTAFTSKSKFLNTIFYVLNMIKIPSPVLEFSNRSFLVHALY